MAPIAPHATLLSDPEDIAVVLGYSGDFSITVDFADQPIDSDHDSAWSAGRKAASGALRAFADGPLTSVACEAFDEMIDAWPTTGPVTDGLARMERATRSIIARLRLGNDDASRACEHVEEILALLFEMSGDSDAGSRPDLARRVGDGKRSLYREVLASLERRRARPSPDDLVG